MFAGQRDHFVDGGRERGESAERAGGRARRHGSPMAPPMAIAATRPARKPAIRLIVKVERGKAFDQYVLIVVSSR